MLKRQRILDFRLEIHEDFGSLGNRTGKLKQPIVKTSMQIPATHAYSKRIP
jgi:hypothetical protein